MTLVPLDLAWVSFCPRPLPRSLGAWRQLRLGQRGPTGPRRGAGDNAGARLPLCRTTAPGVDSGRAVPEVPEGSWGTLLWAGPGGQVARLRGWRARGGQRRGAGGLVHEALGPGFWRPLSVGRGGPGGPLLLTGPWCGGSLSRSPPRQPCHYLIGFLAANPRLRVVSPES